MNPVSTTGTRAVMLLACGALLLGATGCGESSQVDATDPGATTATPAPSASASRVHGGEDQRAAASASAIAEESGFSPDPTATPELPGSERTASPSEAATSAATAAPLPSAKGEVKSFASAKLPEKFAGYEGTLSTSGDTTMGMYTGSNADQMLMVTLVKGTGIDKVAEGMADVAVEDHAVCGKQSGIETCLIQLDGGYVHVQGSDADSRGELARATNALWETLA